MLHHSRSLTALLLLACFSLTACDSGKDEASPQEELTAMFADMQSALTLAFTAGAGKTSMPSVNCPQGGTLDVTASGGSGNTFNQSLKYNNCNGINGSLAMRGSSAFSGQDLTYNVTLNGSLKKQCDLSINDFDQRIKTNMQNPQSATVTLNGSMSAQCSSGSTTCTFTNTTYNLSSGEATFTSNCK